MLDTAQRTMHITTLLLAVLAVALFTTPAALHRTLFQRGAKPEIVMISSRLAGAGMRVLMLALTGSVLLVVDVVLGRVEGVVAGSATLLVCGGLWGVLPQLVRRHAAQSEAWAVSEPPAGSG
jgi:predicted phage tail protein